MKALIYADLQATDGHEQCWHDPTIPLQRWRVQKFFQELHKIFENKECDGLVDLGDTFDDRDAIPVPTIDTVLEGLELFGKPTSEFANIKLVGNHDQFIRSGDVHSGRLFKPFFDVIDEPRICMTDDQSTRIICLPYPPNDKEMMTWLREAQEATQGLKTILLGHFQVLGSMLGDGPSVSGVPLRMLESFSIVLLGHVHVPQSMGNVHYIGSPFQQDFGEKNQVKRVAILDTKTLTLEWIPLDGFPRYIETDLGAFMKCVTQDGEDRYRVHLKSAQEAEIYYAHPMASRAQPILSYDLVQEEKQGKSASPTWSTRAILERHVEAVPPASFGISLPKQEMVDISLQIAESPAQ